MVPQKKVNRHVFNLIVARGVAESKRDMAKFDLVERKVKLEKLHEQLADISRKIGKEMEKIAKLEEIINAPLPPLPENVTPSPSVTPSHFG